MLLVQTSPPLSKNPHLEPRFPDGGWVEGIRFCGGAERRDQPLKGGWSHSLPVGDSGDVVFCLVGCLLLGFSEVRGCIGKGCIF